MLIVPSNKFSSVSTPWTCEFSSSAKKEENKQKLINRALKWEMIYLCCERSVSVGSGETHEGSYIHSQKKHNFISYDECELLLLLCMCRVLGKLRRFRRAPRSTWIILVYSPKRRACSREGPGGSLIGRDFKIEFSLSFARSKWKLLCDSLVFIASSWC